MGSVLLGSSSNPVVGSHLHHMAMFNDLILQYIGASNNGDYTCLAKVEHVVVSGDESGSWAHSEENFLKWGDRNFFSSSPQQSQLKSFLIAVN